MIERQVPHDEARRRLEEIRKGLEVDKPIEIPIPEEAPHADTADQVTDEDKKNLQDFKLKPFSEEDAENMNKRYPDTF